MNCNSFLKSIQFRQKVNSIQFNSTWFFQAVNSIQFMYGEKSTSIRIEFNSSIQFGQLWLGLRLRGFHGFKGGHFQQCMDLAFGNTSSVWTALQQCINWGGGHHLAVNGLNQWRSLTEVYIKLGGGTVRKVWTYMEHFQPWMFLEGGTSSFIWASRGWGCWQQYMA